MTLLSSWKWKKTWLWTSLCGHHKTGESHGCSTRDIWIYSPVSVLRYWPKFLCLLLWSQRYFRTLKVPLAGCVLAWANIVLPVTSLLCLSASFAPKTFLPPCPFTQSLIFPSSWPAAQMLPLVPNDKRGKCGDGSAVSQSSCAKDIVL